MTKGKKTALWTALAVGLLLSCGLLWWTYTLIIHTPDFTQLRGAVQIPIKLANGDESFLPVGPRAPGWVPRSQISDALANAVVASEDTSFFSHSGVDMHEIQEALKKDIKEGRFARGASTLTQQVIKNVFLTSEKSLVRKVRELVLAPRMEKVLSKTEILTFYLNMAEWGPGIYGCGRASNYYFSIPPSQLTPKQAAFLAMLLPSPRKYHEYFRSRRLTQWANKRVNRILSVMEAMSMLPPGAFNVAMEENLWGQPALPDNTPDPGTLSDGDVFFKAATGASPLPAPDSTLTRTTPTEASPPEQPAQAENLEDGGKPEDSPSRVE